MCEYLFGKEQLERSGQCFIGTLTWCRGVRRTREGVQGVRESQGRQARQGAGFTKRTCTV